MNDIPYPGIRPFKREESRFFFGRDKHIEELLERLQQTHFVSVTGLSGCGKSSLVQAGLLPSLSIASGTEWLILEMRPGLDPLKNLSQTILTYLNRKNTPDQPVKNYTLENVSFYFESYRHFGLARILEDSLPLEYTPNVLLLIDQFEELFQEGTQVSFEEKKEFVNILLSSSEQRDVPIYVVITIRSETIGECARYRGLTEAINAGQFFVPDLTQQELRKAIVDPPKVLGGKVNELFVDDRLLHEIEQVKCHIDQLPILQHCLMQMWFNANGRKEKEQQNTIEIKEDDYEAVNRLENAISKHANRIFDVLSPKQQGLAEKMFRFLIEPEERKLERIRRHPATLGDIIEVTESSEQELIAIINTFRSSESCFITPYSDIKNLSYESEISITHESLIRQWDKLNKWAIQEAKSAETYKRLEHTACLWRKGEAALWGHPDLGVALAWKEREHPTAAWANRYGEHFDLAMEFLDASQKAQEERRLQKKEQEKIALQHQIELESEKKLRQEAEARQKAEEKAHVEQRKATKRFRLLAIVLAIMTVIAGGGAWLAIQERNESEEQKNLAIAAKEEALNAQQEAQKAQQEALEAQTQAELHSLRFQDMVNATFGFLAESDMTQQFIQWTQKTLPPERLNPALLVMIDSAERLNEAQKESLKVALLTMTDAERQELFDILGTEAAEKIRGQKATLDKNFANSIIIKDETGNTIPLQDGSYVLRPEQRVNINVTNSAALFKQAVRFEYWPLQGRIESKSTYIAPANPGTPDIVSIKAIDTQTGQIVSEASIKINVIPSESKQVIDNG